MKLPVSSKDEKKIKKFASGPISPSPLTTAIESIKDWSEHATPQAQTMQDFEDIDRISNARNIDDIPKGAGVEKIDQEVDSTPIRRILKMRPIFGSESEIKALRAALDGCWSLCNTLASLSYIHRERLKFKGDVQEEAWISCWRLCQELYDSQDINTNVSQASLTLDLCRHFCQALFDARHRDNELADSVLRVSFELNNHLYNTHDRNLPDAFRERTLAFYVTLCHRLMKQRTRNTNTEPLLSACWSLAELLFSIRQNERESRQSNEDLLSSAVQACWELCDIFREGWTRRSVRNSDRGTPRPSQATFAQTVTQTEQPDLYLNERLSGQQGNPETPTTIFEDTVSTSPDEAPVQNIFVLGQISTHVSQTKWPSNSSSVSGQTQSSERSANTITILPNTPNLTSLKVLIIKAAMNSGFQRSGPQSLSSFVKSLSSDAFGSMTWQISLLRSYKRMVAFDPTFQYVGPQARASAIEIAGAVQETVQRGQCPWLNDLYRLVFGFRMEEAVRRKDIILQT
ncbi:uncharacterized protein ATNIH1004_006957 [Aspergillus tanneri]|uniref:DUF7624 domain-containing protein n=1 Tax=Aspergillus tanneri TaxID=1220188 RepID=A0A5M9MEY2_9EURO|nr:uncharacterized protein ATNIH1004_006957 [Aspergillus tanneri]KAA8645538.1 hypothetical protein ATNIH1004_006957 [Aspergillus tanneri]